MVTRALEKYLRISAKRMKPIAGLVRNKKVSDAIYILMNINQKGAQILKKVVESALNNAKRLSGKNFTEENLFISKLSVDGGPTLKRFRAMSMGRAGVIRKRTSHILVELDVHDKGAKKRKKTVKAKEKITKAGKK